jgi:cytochrome P450
MDVTTLPLPPGSSGWPLLGEALALGKNPYQFIAERAGAHGAVARSKILDKDLAILAGAEAAQAFLDEQNIQRAGGLPPHAAGLFGSGVVNQIDDAAHRARKQHLMRALDREALAHYLPTIRAQVRKRLANWADLREVSLQTQAILLTQALHFACLAGLEPDDATLARYAEGYGDFGKALVGLPLALPGTPLHRARRFIAEMLATLEKVADARRANGTGDGISRLAASVVDGSSLSSRDIALETNHLLFAGGGIWSWIGSGVCALDEDRALQDTLRTAAKGLSEEPSGRELMECAPLHDFVREVKRLGFVIPFTAIGVARRDFAVGGKRIPKGWLVLWATHASHTVPGVAPYGDPARFDPSRYGRGEGAGPHEYAPQGPGEALASHRCGGVEYSTLILLAFFAELLRGPAFSLPAQDKSLDMSAMPARWKSGLSVRFG